MFTLPTYKGPIMIVACSTLCFARHPLEKVFEFLTELDFTRFEVVVHDHSLHLQPDFAIDDPHRTSGYLKQRPGILPSGFYYREARRDLAREITEVRNLATLARHCQVPLITVMPSSTIDFSTRENERFEALLATTAREGVELAVATHGGTWAAVPETLASACRHHKSLSVTLDPTHLPILDLSADLQNLIFERVAHVHLRDSGKGPSQFQTRVGKGQVEHGRILNLLERNGYQRLLSIDIHDIADSPFPVFPEVRKMKFLLESLL